MKTDFSFYQSKLRNNIEEHSIYEQLSNVLDQADFSFLGNKYSGKVRDCYLQNQRRILITSDRLSCFDVVVTTIPFKGQVLNQLAVDWFRNTGHIISNHLIDVPHPNVMVVKNCEILPVEVVVRGYLTGSAWRDYQAGKLVSGVRLPDNLKKSAKFAEPLLTPSTKAPKGSHDQPIAEADIIAGNIVAKSLWQQVRETALALFDFGTKQAAEQGLILVDTKYEFGLINGQLILADEIHTLDSSRYWRVATYENALEKGVDPENLDKEPTRQWLLSQGYQGDGAVPEFTKEHRVAIARHYISSYEQITGKTFDANSEPVKEQLESVLKSYHYEN